MASITKKGARSVTQTLDRVASLLQQDWKALGVPQKVAHDFAFRCDLLSDHIERKAGLKRSNFDAEEIGVEKKGPLESEPDEPYMKGEFSQQENRELRERVEDADLGMTPNPDPLPPSNGKQAFVRVGQTAISNSLSASISQIQSAAVRMAKTPKLASSLCVLASAIQQAQKGILMGQTSAIKSARILEAVSLLSLENPSPKLASMVDLAIKVAEEEEKEEEEKEEAAEEPEESDDSEKASKKAHGFNLYA